MSDPFALLPLALAAGGGRLNDVETGRAVAAGFTLLQRCAPLVRALAGKRAVAVLPAGPAFLCALAASDGRGLSWSDPNLPSAELHRRTREHRVGAVFTTRAYVATCREAFGPELPLVLLDEAPKHARVQIPRDAGASGDSPAADAAGREIVVDLGSHFGLSVEGQREAEGRDEECLLVGDRALSHRELLAEVRAFGVAAGLTPVDRTLTIMPTVDLDVFVAGVATPLFFGGAVYVTDAVDQDMLDRIAPTRLVSADNLRAQRR